MKSTIFFKFLWDGKGDKIKRDIMINEYEDGGLKMINIRLFTQALKLSWVRSYLDKEMRQNEPIDWKAAYRLHFECTKISKLRVFQFKLLQRRLATNDFLKKNKAKG